MAAVFIVVITALIVLATTAVLVGRGPVRGGGRGGGRPNHRFGPPYDPALTHDDDTDAAGRDPASAEAVRLPPDDH
ncbi:hypothetical protein [Streptomyces mirabilis]|uniref:Secreted protein n=1 Tax=Streptomyces mirabilis TaxID=68239 RepID=A0ABU3V0T1_9ACTN|nr:hypothetical protein [Streptomyces mirabilis]KPI16836.1 hypothetical protein OK006_2657 [Actinobacteria bacterium OK006]MDU8999590.1 hypothetical protein [Streptomyces mirabilis]